MVIYIFNILKNVYFFFSKTYLLRGYGKSHGDFSWGKAQYHLSHMGYIKLTIGQ